MAKHKKMTSSAAGFALMASLTAGLFLAGCTDNDSDKTASEPNAFETLSLEDRFKSPLQSDRPRTWFHVMSGNMAKDGLTKDFEAMNQGGIGGALFFNISQFTPVGPVKFGSDEHFDLVAHAGAQAERYNMSFGVHNSDGWTSSGGPWITPEMSMKEVTWSDVQIAGGNVDVTLPSLPSRFDYSEDIAVLAYPALPREMNEAKFTLSSNYAGFDPEPLLSIKLDDKAALPFNEETPNYIQFTYDTPVTLTGLTAAHEGPWRKHLTLHASADGETFEEVMQLPRRRLGQDKSGYEAQFDGLKGKAFRLYANEDIALSELHPTTERFISERLARTSLHRPEITKLGALEAPDADNVIAKGSIVDVTKFVGDDGRLKTQLPDGDWTILRIGYTSTGSINHPASAEGTGLEVDKFARGPVKVHYDAYMGEINRRLRTAAPTANQYTLIDSYEVGGQNWTAGYEDLYAKEFGDELRAMLPVLTGRFVENAQETSTTLRRMRELNAQLFAENYVSYFKTLANNDGLDLYIEPYGFGPFNEIDSGTAADIPKGEFWLDDRSTKVSAAVSSSNILGQPIVSAEAFTSRPNINWKFHPGMAKSMGDEAWALGINEFMFHRFAHQPNDKVKPGMVMSFFGAHIDRTQLWWPMAMKPWTDYISRGQTLLREGRAVVPIAVYMSSDSPATCPERGQLPSGLSKEYGFDCLSGASLHSATPSAGGDLNLPSGMSYDLLHIVDNRCLSLETLQSLDRLTKGGVGLVADRPEPCAVADGNPQTRVSLVSQIWGRDTVSALSTWDAAMQRYDIQPSVMALSGAPLPFAHRKTDTRDIFLIANPGQDSRASELSFAASSGAPSFWDPMTGDIKPIVNYRRSNERTILTLPLDAEEAGFVVFDKTKDTAPIEANAAYSNKQPVFARQDGTPYQDLKTGETLTLSGPWSVRFDPDYGDIPDITLPALVDLKDHPNADVRHYAGPIYYRTIFDAGDLPAGEASMRRLDLGDVAVSAKISLNGQDIGVHWHESQDFDVTDYLKPTGNVLEIEVANTWVNRLIADAAIPRSDDYKRGQKVVTRKMPDWFINNEPAPGERTTFSTIDFYKSDDPLVPSGLIGPVKLSGYARRCLSQDGKTPAPCPKP